jgi:hypothetical protein
VRAWGDWPLTKPTVGIAGCCACATIGQAAAPPSNVMNSRRRISLLPTINGTTIDAEMSGHGV